MNEQRKIISKKDSVLILIPLLLAAFIAAFFYWKQSSANCVAALSIDGTIVEVYTLEKEENRLIDLDASYGVPVILEIKDGAIRFYQSQCPDHLCEQSGFLSQEAEIAVCLPNRTAVTIYAASDHITANTIS